MKLIIFITEVVVVVTIVLLIHIRSAVVARDLGLLSVNLKRSLTKACLANNVELKCELFHGLLNFAK